MFFFICFLLKKPPQNYYIFFTYASAREFFPNYWVFLSYAFCLLVSRCRRVTASMSALYVRTVLISLRSNDYFALASVIFASWCSTPRKMTPRPLRAKSGRSPCSVILYKKSAVKRFPYVYIPLILELMTTEHIIYRTFSFPSLENKSILL